MCLRVRVATAALSMLGSKTRARLLKRRAGIFGSPLPRDPAFFVDAGPLLEHLATGNFIDLDLHSTGGSAVAALFRARVSLLAKPAAILARCCPSTFSTVHSAREYLRGKSGLGGMSRQVSRVYAGDGGSSLVLQSVPSFAASAFPSSVCIEPQRHRTSRRLPACPMRSGRLRPLSA